MNYAKLRRSWDVSRPQRIKIEFRFQIRDRYGERWIGCLDCNKWGKPGDRNLVMELANEDLEALRAVSR